jgi:hypothetical protein
MLVKITATLANGMPVQMVQALGDNTLSDFEDYYSELVKNGSYLNATVALSRP